MMELLQTKRKELGKGIIVTRPMLNLNHIDVDAAEIKDLTKDCETKIKHTVC